MKKYLTISGVAIASALMLTACGGGTPSGPASQKAQSAGGERPIQEDCEPPAEPAARPGHLDVGE